MPRVIEKLADHLEGNSLWSQADSWWKMRLTSAICLKPPKKELSCAKSGEVSRFLLPVLPQLPTSLWISWSSFYSDPDHPVSLKQQERWETCQIWIVFDRKISLCYCLSWELSSIKKITMKTASLSFILFFFFITSHKNLKPIRYGNLWECRDLGQSESLLKKYSLPWEGAREDAIMMGEGRQVTPKMSRSPKR